MTHPLHRKALELAVTYRNSEALLFKTLLHMAELNLFLELDYVGMRDYLIRGLHISESQTGYFVRVAKKARAISELKNAIVSGMLSLSQARRIVGVIEKDTASLWINDAINLKQKDLERKVAEHSPRAVVQEGFEPISASESKLTVVVTLEQEKAIERAQDVLSQKQKKSASLQETISYSIDCFLNRHDPLKKAIRASSRMSPSTTSKATPGVRTPTPASVEHLVTLRDQAQCTKKTGNSRCQNRRFLDQHHLIHVAHGGPNTPGNLTTLCSAHHAMEHLQKR